MFTLGKRSKERLVGVHPDLVLVVKRALELSEIDFSVLEGVRTIDRQKELVRLGASTTMNSRHITGHAVDLGAYVAGHIDWTWELYEKIANAMYQASIELGIKIKWGGDWVHLKDGPHFQLDWERYGINK